MSELLAQVPIQNKDTFLGYWLLKGWKLLVYATEVENLQKKLQNNSVSPVGNIQPVDWLRGDPTGHSVEELDFLA